MAVLGIGLVALLATGIALAGPVSAKAAVKATPKPTPTVKPTPTPTPFPTPVPTPTTPQYVAGRHIYDFGKALTPALQTAAEALAAHIEQAGGGRVVLYTADDAMNVPPSDTFASQWFVDGLLLIGSPPNYGTVKVGATLSGKLSKAQTSAIETSPGVFTFASWLMSDLARVDAFLSNARVWDGTGTLDPANKAEAETAVKSLSDKLKTPVYVDISLGDDDPSSASFFNVAHLSTNFKQEGALVIALGVSGTNIAGDIETDNSDLWNRYETVAPWKSTSLSVRAASQADVAAQLLAAIKGVQVKSSSSLLGPSSGGGLDPETIFWIIFVAVMVVIGIGSPFYGAWLIRKISGVSGPIKGGLPGEAVIQSMADTGVTVTMPSVGPDAPEYKLGLQVTPAAGGTPYEVETKTFVPRIFIPMIVPGARFGVQIDPKDPNKVSIDFNQSGGSQAGADADAQGVPAGQGGPAIQTGQAGLVGMGGMDFQFDAGGRPTEGEVSALVGAVRGGSVPSINSSADQLLATGAHGTAVVTTCQPLGKRVRDMMPSAPADRLDDPVWVFTVEVTLPGQSPFPAVFGHRVPMSKIASIGPGSKLAVSVDESNKNQDVAIDWTRSPIGM